MTDTPKTLVSPSHVALLALSVIVAEPMYGYRIITELEARSEGYFQMQECRLYPVLYQLEKNGLVTSAWRGEKGRRHRRYYTITATGIAALAAAKNEFARHTRAMNLVIEQSAAGAGPTDSGA